METDWKILKQNLSDKDYKVAMKVKQMKRNSMHADKSTKKKADRMATLR